LLELMLVIALVAMLAGMVWPNLPGRLTGKQLIHSASRLNSVLQICRSSAMTQAKRYRCVWDANTNRMIVQIEREPLESPGEFTDLKAHWARSSPLIGKVKCIDVRIRGWSIQQEKLDSSGPAPGQLSSEQLELQFVPLVFGPDGTCDPAIIILEDQRGKRKVLELNRLTGQATVRDPLPDELDQVEGE